MAVLFSPFYTLAARTTTNITFQRVQSAFLEPILDALASQPEEDVTSRSTLLHPTYDHLAANSCLDEPTEGAIDRSRLRKGLLRAIFETASQQESRDSNRRKLYSIWKNHVEDDDDSGPQLLDAS